MKAQDAKLDEEQDVQPSMRVDETKAEPMAIDETLVEDVQLVAPETIDEERTIPAELTIPETEAGEGGRTFLTEESVPAEWQVGDRIMGIYQVVGNLGKGGMGRVYKVHHIGWNVDLAVKVPLPRFFETEEHKRNFIREAETWANLGLHPHIVSCYYVRILGGTPRIFAEYIDWTLNKSSIAL